MMRVNVFRRSEARPKPRHAVAGLLFVLLFCPRASAVDRNELLGRYASKYLVVVHDGLAVGTCATRPSLVTLIVWVRGDSAEFPPPGSLRGKGCEEIVPERLHKGEVLSVLRAYFNQEGLLTIKAEDVSPHQVERGTGAFGHESFERGRVDMVFEVADPEKYEAVASLVDKWLKAFGTEAEASKFGNTASGVFVKEVRIGMSFGEVEAALGPPQTRVDLGRKVLYKYKDMTVEFHDGKVTDVR
jgi:hypothetical protein